MKKGQVEYWEKKTRECGLRLTRQRKEILQTLVQATGPLSAREIFLKLKPVSESFELSTVYRSLHSFMERGLVRETDLGTGEKKYELNSGEHGHHLVCVGCGEILFLGCPLREFEREVKEKTRYEIIEHRLNVLGVCPSCKGSE